MATAYSTGAALLYAGVGQNKAPMFVGTFETRPRITISPAWSKLGHVLAGTSNAFDEGFQGSVGSISGIVTRFNSVVLEAMMARPDAGQWQRAGSWALSEIGKLHHIENMDWPCWVKYPRAIIPAYGGSMVAGYRFYSCKLVGPDNMMPETDGYRIGIIIECKPVLLKMKAVLTKIHDPPPPPPRSQRNIWTPAPAIFPGHNENTENIWTPDEPTMPRIDRTVYRTGRWYLYDHEIAGLPPIN